MKAIQHIIKEAPPHWVGDGFPVRSLFNYSSGSRFDPFLVLDYAGPYEFAPHAAKRGVGQHPHRGFETVTIVYDGELEHRDSGGNQGKIGPGDVQWMTAASGVLHEEFHSEQFSKNGGVLEMVQLWVNLPAKEKMTPPRYQEVLDQDIPAVSVAGGAGTVRVIAGEFNGTTGPARTVTPIHVWDVSLKAGHSLTLPVPDGCTTVAVIQKGKANVNHQHEVQAVQLVEFDRVGAGVELESVEDLQVLVLSGLPIGEPVVGQGPFVMNTRQEIHQAIVDFQNGRFGQMPD